MSKFAGIAMAIGIAVAGVAQAQSLGQIAARTGLSPDDFALLSAASESLYVAQTPRVGASQSWKSDKTGSSGTTRVTEVKDNCVRLEHSVTPAGAAPRVVRGHRCKSADGRWLMQAE